MKKTKNAVQRMTAIERKKTEARITNIGNAYALAELGGEWDGLLTVRILNEWQDGKLLKTVSDFFKQMEIYAYGYGATKGRDRRRNKIQRSVYVHQSVKRKRGTTYHVHIYYNYPRKLASIEDKEDFDKVMEQVWFGLDEMVLTRQKKRELGKLEKRHNAVQQPQAELAWQQKTNKHYFHKEDAHDTTWKFAKYGTKGDTTQELNRWEENLSVLTTSKDLWRQIEKGLVVYEQLYGENFPISYLPTQQKDKYY